MFEFKYAPNCTALFDDQGVLRMLQTPQMVLPLEGVGVDVGVDGLYLRNTLEFQSFLDFNTWSLPAIRTQLTNRKEMDFVATEANQGELLQRYRLGLLELTLRYYTDCGQLAVEALVCNRSSFAVWVNGTAIELQLAVECPESLTFDFPGNLPYGSFCMEQMDCQQTVETGLVAAVTHLEQPEGHLNLIYINSDEKWGTGVSRLGTNRLAWSAVAATELMLEPDQQYRCGSLYIQPLGHGDRFAPIRRFYYEKGWRVPSDGVQEAVVYSCHPKGTMDTDWALSYTLPELGQFTPRIAQMGVDTIWLLPIFDHYQLGDPDRNVYTPLDHETIDHRYGNDQDVRTYIEQAREQGARVIFDYVPHGPRPQDPMGIEKLDCWASLRQDGSPQIEWTCLSFDMANPTYLNYIKEMVCDHIRRFGLEGTRIDCAMGGLSNWRPCHGNRPSNSNMKGGVAVSKVMRQAFVEAGIKPFVTPENFHPIPLYASCTDAYYDMALYRVLHDLNKADITRSDYVEALTRWLEHQMLSMPEGQNKLRFLGNHDTVSWVWDCKRATSIYGVDRAKAMWVLISLIDGCPMIYQGDENPEFYLCDTAPNLEEFFAELFTVKKTHTSYGHSTVYHYTGTGLFACQRVLGEDCKLLLVNLDNRSLGYHCTSADLLYGNAEIQDGTITLQPNEYALLRQ